MRKINLASERILHIINYLSSKFDKAYCFPSQQTILNLLKSHHGIEISRRTLNYNLAFLEAKDFILRVPRIRDGGQGVLLFKSTMYWLKKKGYGVLSKVAAGLARAKYRVRKWWLEKNGPVPASRKEPASILGNGFNRYNHVPRR